MKVAITLSGIYLIIMGAFGYLFGQLFFGDFTLAATMAGVFGVVAGVITVASNSATMGRLAFVSCVLAGVGFVIDAHTYYTKYDIPGNDFAWELRGPFVIALLVITYASLRRVSE